jgi:hypothetical protein
VDESEAGPHVREEQGADATGHLYAGEFIQQVKERDNTELITITPEINSGIDIAGN